MTESSFLIEFRFSPIIDLIKIGKQIYTRTLALFALTVLNQYARYAVAYFSALRPKPKIIKIRPFSIFIFKKSI